MIPKIIFYTWISDKPLPDKYKIYIDGWRSLMPDYEIVEINLENCHKNEWVNEAIQAKKYVLASHYSRLSFLYENGGVYCDIDIEAVKRFDKLLNNEFFAGVEDRNVINNAIFGAVKGHQLLKTLMDETVKIDIDSEKVELETGPRLFTKNIKKLGWEDGQKDLFINDIWIYGEKFFYPYRYDEKFTKDCITQETHAIHHWASSWDTSVSVVIPCYNYGIYLADAINSCLSQTLKPSEIIVVNDGSTDNTAEIAKSFGDKIKYIYQENKGLSSARNIGIGNAKGKYILTLDADDIIDPFFIEKTIGKDDIVSTYLKEFGDSETEWKAPKINPVYEDFLINNQINCCSLFLRKIWQDVGGYDEEMKTGYEDWQFWRQATKRGYKVLVIPEFLFFYRKHGRSLVDKAKENHKELLAYMSLHN